MTIIPQVKLGDASEVLSKMPDKFFQLCVCSPPYWGLRSYLPADHPNKHLEIGKSEGGSCSKCGAPRERIVELGEPDLAHQQACGGDLLGQYDGKAKKDYDGNKVQNASDVKRRILAGMRERKTVGWKDTCQCMAKSVPCSVLDPFHGTGTTGQACIELGRDYTGIDLSEDYIKASETKISQTSLALL